MITICIIIIGTINHTRSFSRRFLDARKTVQWSKKKNQKYNPIVRITPVRIQWVYNNTCSTHACISFYYYHVVLFYYTIARTTCKLLCAPYVIVTPMHAGRTRVATAGEFPSGPRVINSTWYPHKCRLPTRTSLGWNHGLDTCCLHSQKGRRWIIMPISISRPSSFWNDSYEIVSATVRSRREKSRINYVPSVHDLRKRIIRCCVPPCRWHCLFEVRSKVSIHGYWCWMFVLGYFINS